MNARSDRFRQAIEDALNGFDETAKRVEEMDLESIQDPKLREGLRKMYEQAPFANALYQFTRSYFGKNRR